MKCTNKQTKILWLFVREVDLNFSIKIKKCANIHKPLQLTLQQYDRPEIDLRSSTHNPFQTNSRWLGLYSY